MVGAHRWSDDCLQVERDQGDCRSRVSGITEQWAMVGTAMAVDGMKMKHDRPSQS